MDLSHIIVDSSFKKMNQFIQAMTSRTVGVFLVVFLTAGFQAISSYFSPQVFVMIMGVLSLAGTYFKVNPSQPYGPTQG